MPDGRGAHAQREIDIDKMGTRSQEEEKEKGRRGRGKLMRQSASERTIGAAFQFAWGFMLIVGEEEIEG